MQQIQTEIIINASAEKVWNVLMDFEKFQAWNPFILALEGKPEVGTTLKVTLKNGNSSTVMKPEVLIVEKNQRFEWLGSLPLGLFKGQHKFVIERISDRQVKFVHGEQFGGLLAGLILKYIGEQTRNGFIAMNKALKQRAEK